MIELKNVDDGKFPEGDILLIEGDTFKVGRLIWSQEEPLFYNSEGNFTVYGSKYIEIKDIIKDSTNYD